MNDLPLLYQSLGSYGRAERLFRHAMEIYRQALGEEFGFARSWNDLAGSYDLMGTYDLAEPLYRQALAIQRGSPKTGGTELGPSRNSVQRGSRVGTTSGPIFTCRSHGRWHSQESRGRVGISSGESWDDALMPSQL